LSHFAVGDDKNKKGKERKGKDRQTDRQTHTQLNENISSIIHVAEATKNY